MISTAYYTSMRSTPKYRCWSYELLIPLSIDSGINTEMYILLFSDGEFVLQVMYNLFIYSYYMYMYNFGRRIFYLFTNDQKSDWFLSCEYECEFRWSSDRVFAQKVWDSWGRHGYIEEHYYPARDFVNGVKFSQFMEIQIDILFYSENELVARINMCASTFDTAKFWPRSQTKRSKSGFQSSMTITGNSQ